MAGSAIDDDVSGPVCFLVPSSTACAGASDRWSALASLAVSDAALAEAISGGAGLFSDGAEAAAVGSACGACFYLAVIVTGSGAASQYNIPYPPPRKMPIARM
jgi:bacterioferritin-associated ferredoxin